MYLGCQFFLYPMTDRFIEVILDGLTGIRAETDRLRVETDDLSTLLVGAPEALFPALQACFVKAAGHSGHLVMNLSLSRGCPGEPDDPICRSPALREAAQPAGPGRIDAALARERPVTPTGIAASAQIALYPLGRPDYMADIADCIGYLRRADLAVSPKHFCTRLDGDAAAVFQAIETSFLGFAGHDDHVVLTAVLSKGSPSAQARAA
jgi:energy-coupling factor transport system substrate-specific component